MSDYPQELQPTIDRMGDRAGEAIVKFVAAGFVNAAEYLEAIGNETAVKRADLILHQMDKEAMKTVGDKHLAELQELLGAVTVSCIELLRGEVER